jgi:hypothetical protein
MIDYNDSKALWEFGNQTIEVAESYYKARESFANALKTLKIALAKAYSENSIETRVSEDKAFIMLAETNEDCKSALNDMVTMENQYKGLEKILEARSALQMLYQSLIKNARKES